MIRIVILGLIITIMASRLLQSDEITGRLKIKSSKGISKVYSVKSALNSPQVTNIVHQVITLITPNPLHGCSQHTNLSQIQELKKESQSIFFVVRGVQGGCSYAKKVENARKVLGNGNGIIIVDSDNGLNNLKSRLQQKDKFITLLISQAEGKNILHQGRLQGELDMSHKQPKNATVFTIEIWVSSLNKQSYHVLNDWKQALEEISSQEVQIKWKPRFALYSCFTDGICQKNQFISSCACGGQFCSPETFEKSSNVLVREDIRQYLIFQEHPDKYLEYVSRFYEKCFEKYEESKHADDCAHGIVSQMDLSENINKNLDKFLTECIDQNNNQQALRIYEGLSLDKAKYNQIRHYPTVILNHEQLEFKNKKELKSLLCKKMSLQNTDGCVSVASFTTIVTNFIAVFFYLSLFVLLLGAGAFVVIFFRNYLRKEMNKEMKMQVSTAVQHYFTLSESKQLK